MNSLVIVFYVQKSVFHRYLVIFKAKGKTSLNEYVC